MEEAEDVVADLAMTRPSQFVLYTLVESLVITVASHVVKRESECKQPASSGLHVDYVQLDIRYEALLSEHDQ